ncbi:MAG: phosphoglycerate kinase [Rubrivivax sp.]|nr:MAG: phosphoglycerate kinase [Rubrivivax sp.]
MPLAAEPLSTYTPGSLPGLDGLDVNGKRVLLRVDYNIPTTADGSLEDDYRLEATLPTIRRLLRDGARLGILTHRGRPGGRAVAELSTKPLAKLLSEMLGQEIMHVPDSVGRMAEQAMEQLAPGQALMFENVRYHLGEQLNQQTFVLELAKLADIFVNDAFATAHRAHASTSGLAAAMNVSVLGDLMMRELGWLRRMASEPKKPMVLVLGGQSVEPKLDLLRRMLGRADTVMLGGAVANTFMAARDLGMGQSTLDPTFVDSARDALTEAGVVGCRLHLPQDVWVRRIGQLDDGAEAKTAHTISAQESVVDVGPQTLKTWQRLIEGAGTVLFLGSVGITEKEIGRQSTLGLLQTVTSQRGYCLVGGNGLMPVLRESGLKERLDCLSTGGASLVNGLLGKPFPCIDAVKR